MASFLERLGKGNNTRRKSAARGLLGEVRREDLIDAGRLEAVELDRSARRALDEQSGMRITPKAGRRFERVPLAQRVEVRGFARLPKRMPLVANLSSGGLFLETAHVLDVGDPVVVCFDDPWAPKRFSVSGRVRWVSPFGRLGEARPGMGIELLTSDPVTRARIDELLVRASAEATP
jgi:Tfp pilus assembly protein PilZ